MKPYTKIRRFYAFIGFALIVSVAMPLALYLFGKAVTFDYCRIWYHVRCMPTAGHYPFPSSDPVTAYPSISYTTSLTDK